MKKLLFILALSIAAHGQAAPWVKINHLTCASGNGNAWDHTFWNPIVEGAVVNFWQNTFVDSTTVASCDGSGNFVLTCNPGTPPTCGFMVSGQLLNTQNATPSESWKYVWINFNNVVMPWQSGISSAVFLASTRYLQQVNWGELDVAENLGSTNAKSQTIHNINQSGISFNAASACTDGASGVILDTIPAAGNVNDVGGHQYGVLWIPNTRYYYIDGTLLGTRTAGLNGCTDQQNDSYYLALDMFVGDAGNTFVGAPNNGTFTGPVSMTVGSIDVWVLPKVANGQKLQNGQKAQ